MSTTLTTQKRKRAKRDYQCSDCEYACDLGDELLAHSAICYEKCARIRTNADRTRTCEFCNETFQAQMEHDCAKQREWNSRKKYSWSIDEYNVQEAVDRFARRSNEDNEHIEPSDLVGIINYLLAR